MMFSPSRRNVGPTTQLSRSSFLLALFLLVSSFVGRRQLQQYQYSLPSFTTPFEQLGRSPPLTSVSSVAAPHAVDHSDINKDYKQWNPEIYLQLARTGPRRCIDAPCYIVDVIADPYQPRLFLSLLGLPASDIERKQRGQTTNVTMVDVRSGEDMMMKQSYTLVNDTHGFALLLSSRNKNATTEWNHEYNHVLVAECINLSHQRGTALGAYYESTTYSCDLKPHTLANLSLAWESYAEIRVDVLFGPKSSTRTGEITGPYMNLNGKDHPFFISKNHGYSTSGLFNSVSRRQFVAPEPFLWSHESNEQDSGERSSDMDEDKGLRVSACIIGVDYMSTQHREVIQYHISSGFEHIYLAIPAWPTSDLFKHYWNLLGDFVRDGNVSFIVSEYAACHIQPEHFGKNFTYAPQGHKSSFLNTCILHARAAGDDMAFVGDFDELVEHDQGSNTSMRVVLANELSKRNLTFDNSCSVNLGSVTAYYAYDGYTNSSKIADKIAGLRVGVDSVGDFGKTIHNVKRVLRAGLHGPAYCEAVPSLRHPKETTRPSALREDNNVFRPELESMRTLHLSDSFKVRHEDGDMRKTKSDKAKDLVSYYVRDWSDLVNTELGKRVKARP